MHKKIFQKKKTIPLIRKQFISPMMSISRAVISWWLLRPSPTAWVLRSCTSRAARSWRTSSARGRTDLTSCCCSAWPPERPSSSRSEAEPDPSPLSSCHLSSSASSRASSLPSDPAMFKKCFMKRFLIIYYKNFSILSRCMTRWPYNSKKMLCILKIFFYNCHPAPIKNFRVFEMKCLPWRKVEQVQFSTSFEKKLFNL